jgi:hypothetical protein
MRTIRENLEEAIELLGTNLVLKHIQACELVFKDLSSLKGFDMDQLGVLAYYQTYLIEKHVDLKSVGWIGKIKAYFRSIPLKIQLKDLLNKADSKSFGDGDEYLKQINKLIRKAI